MRVRTRVAPSPTGMAHIGTAYITLFNYAFSQKHEGELVLRIEDTDLKRHVPEAEEEIYKNLRWLGFTWEEGPEVGGRFGPYRQSERLELYQSYAEIMVAEGKAYKEDGAIRYKNKLTKPVEWEDLVRGKVAFPPEELKDFVILKSDGYPTYNFAVVVDDASMAISHVIRAEEHISNTPRQIAIYNALDFDVPYFAHVPILKNPDQSKISKRKNNVSLSWYREQGYLPEALVNFLSLMGWSHPGGKEIYTLDEFIKKFDIKKVRKSGAIFNIDKLDWMNSQYIMGLTDAEFAERAKDFAPKEATKEVLAKIAPLVKERVKKLSELPDYIQFFFKEPEDIEVKLFGEDYKEHLSAAFEALKDANGWSKSAIDSALMNVVTRNSYKTGKFFMDLRVAVTGNKVTPPINDSLVILGREATLSRISKLI